METNVNYVSVDIECSGPNPDKHYIMSIGAVAYGETGNKIAEFFVNMSAPPGKTFDPDTLAWWQQKRHEEAYKNATSNQLIPILAMGLFNNFISRLPHRPVFVSYPAGYDFSWIYCYEYTYMDYNPFGWSAIDLKTYMFAVLNVSWAYCVKKYMPEEWLDRKMPHTHNALDDAREQGALFFAMRNWRNDNLPTIFTNMPAR